MLTLLSFNDEYSVGTQLRDLFIIDVNSIGTEEVLERLSPLLEDRYLDKVVCYQLIFNLQPHVFIYQLRSFEISVFTSPKFETVKATRVFVYRHLILNDEIFSLQVYDCRYIADTLLSTYNCRANSFLDVQVPVHINITLIFRSYSIHLKGSK